MPFELMSKRGVNQHYGQRKVNQKYGGMKSAEFKRTASWVFNYDSLPVNGASGAEFVIPAGSTILSAKLRIISAFTSTSTTTDLTVGLRTKNASGEDIDDDGLITAAQATQTAIAVANAIIDGASGTAAALINKGIGASDGELYVAPTAADLLTGRAEMIVEYLLPSPTQQSM